MGGGSKKVLFGSDASTKQGEGPAGLALALAHAGAEGDALKRSHYFAGCPDDALIIRASAPLEVAIHRPRPITDRNGDEYLQVII